MAGRVWEFAQRRGRRGDRAGIAVLIALAAGGCQTYAPEPLDLDRHRLAWSERSPGSEGVAAFAARLALEEGAQAGAFDVGDGLSVREGEAVALMFNPGLRVARQRAGVAAAHAEYAGLWEDPVLGVDAERILESVDDPWVVGATIGLTLPVSGRLAAERAAAEAERDAELVRIAGEEWSVRMELRRAWLEWSAARARAALAREIEAGVAGIDEMVGALERAGEVSSVEARLFRIDRASRGVERAQSESSEREAELRVRGILGLAPGAPVALVPAGLGAGAGSDSAVGLDIAGNDDRVELMVRQNLALAARRAEYEVAERELRSAIRAQYPDLEIGPGLGSDEGQGRVLLGVSVPLAVWNGGRGEIAEARAEREAARAAFEAEFERLATAMAIAEARLAAALAQQEALDRDIVPLVEQQDAETRRLAGQGEIDTLVLLETLTRLHDTKAAVVEARLAAALAAVEVAELLGPGGGADDAGGEDAEVAR